MFLSWIDKAKSLQIKQNKEWIEVLAGWETANSYSILDENGEKKADLLERSNGVMDTLLKQFLGSHRGFEAVLLDLDQTELLRFKRSAFFILSNLHVLDKERKLLGRAQRRIGIINKKYDLYDNSGQIFARIKSPIWRIWTFRVYISSSDKPIATISKQWSGAFKEAFTDTDNFKIEFGNHNWTSQQKRVIIAAALSIDFDFFENNQGRND